MLPSYSVKRPFTVVVAVVGVLLVGAIAFMNMTPDLLPSMNLPYAMVMTTYVGASPETVEQVVTRPIEQAMATTPNIKTISSISGENLSLVILEYHGDTNMDSTVLEISQTLNQIHAAWNDDAISAPTQNGRPLRIYYGTQVSVAPPTFAIFVNDVDIVHFSYERYLENRLREFYPFLGTPVRLLFRAQRREQST